ncbi:SpnB-like Rossmann fold domain-containing protein [Streptomyces malaysiensis]|uniref:SpnB-like Rossmann fold domain-containing protein n=1 Tax=Streptomyces malaysiensis TaxID=92644 RepID=UPI0038500FFF
MPRAAVVLQGAGGDLRDRAGAGHRLGEDHPACAAGAARTAAGRRGRPVRLAAEAGLGSAARAAGRPGRGGHLGADGRRHTRPRGGAAGRGSGRAGGGRECGWFRGRSGGRLGGWPRGRLGCRPRDRLGGWPRDRRRRRWRSIDPAAAAVWGLVRSAQSEHPGRVRLIDVDGHSHQTLPTALTTAEDQLALRDATARPI